MKILVFLTLCVCSFVSYASDNSLPIPDGHTYFIKGQNVIAYRVPSAFIFPGNKVVCNLNGIDGAEDNRTVQVLADNYVPAQGATHVGVYDMSSTFSGTFFIDGNANADLYFFVKTKNDNSMVAVKCYNTKR